jgi:hypothetical protein
MIKGEQVVTNVCEILAQTDNEIIETTLDFVTSEIELTLTNGILYVGKDNITLELTIPQENLCRKKYIMK